FAQAVQPPLKTRRPATGGSIDIAAVLAGGSDKIRAGDEERRKSVGNMAHSPADAHGAPDDIAQSLGPPIARTEKATAAPFAEGQAVVELRIGKRLHHRQRARDA